MSALFAARLERMGLSPIGDGLGNLMAEVPPSPGREGAPTVILQGHMDMVCAVRPDSGFDPLRDSVQTVTRDGFLRSDGRSSLGADNNLGNATVLWLLGQNILHGPLRLLFTVAEEVGLSGAREVDPAWLTGAKYLINTDGFHLGTAVVSSAGGRRETFSRPLDTAPAGCAPAYRVALSGFTGGHSGDDIHRGRANPIKLLGGLLSLLRDETGFELAQFEGGTGHNVIPAAAAAVLLPEDAAALERAAARLREQIAGEYAATDAGWALALAPVPAPARVWTAPCRDAALGMTGGLLTGVYGWHPDFPGVVAASANLGRVCVADGTVRFSAFLRCMSTEDERRLAARHTALAGQWGFAVHADGYPGWPGDAENPLARRMDTIYRRETGRGMSISAVHVGLEPSFWHEKAPALLIASTGPDILDAHSVDERAPLSSLPPYAALLAGTLEDLAQV